MTINIAGLFSTKDIRIEPVFDEVAVTGQVEEEFVLNYICERCKVCLQCAVVPYW